MLHFLLPVSRQNKVLSKAHASFRHNISNRHCACIKVKEMGTTKGQLKIAFNSGINDTLSTQPSPSMPPCLVVANASTVSQPQDATNAQVAVADESSESKSEEGTRATLVVANGSTGSESESSGLSGADTETQTLRVINGSTASSSLGDSSKEERDPSDLHCNQNGEYDR